MEKVKIVKVGGWFKEKFYRPAPSVLYVIGKQKKETEKAIKIGEQWIPKECIAEIREIREEEFQRHYEEAEDEFDMIERLQLKGALAFTERGKETYVAYD